MWCCSGDGLDHPVLGLFASDHVSYEFDRAQAMEDEPTLQQMTAAAIDFLEKADTADPGDDRGYFLMVEGGASCSEPGRTPAGRGRSNRVFQPRSQPIAALSHPEQLKVSTPAHTKHLVS